MRAKLAIAAIIMLTARPALPCLGFIRNVDDVGPAVWDGREDVPANWVFRDRSIPEGARSGTWWARQLPDGPREELIVSHSVDFITIAPSAPFVVGESYEVFSFREARDGDLPASEQSTDEATMFGVFSIVDEDMTPPDVPDLEVLPTRPVYDPFPPCSNEGVNATLVVVEVSPASEGATYALREEDGAVLRRLQTYPVAMERPVELIDLAEHAGVVSYQVQIIDRAGNMSSAAFDVDLGGPGACSSVGRSGRPIAGLGLLLFVLLIRRKGRQLRVRARIADSHI